MTAVCFRLESRENSLSPACRDEKQPRKAKGYVFVSYSASQREKGPGGATAARRFGVIFRFLEWSSLRNSEAVSAHGRPKFAFYALFRFSRAGRPVYSYSHSYS